MSTIELLEELLDQHRLMPWRSDLMPLKAQVRTFLVTEEVKAVLDANPWSASLFESARGAADRRIRTHTLINQFIEGQNLTVGSGKDDADLKCLSPMPRVPSWRIVEMRASQGSRLTRVLGALPEPDSFVALKVLPRRLIGNWDKVAGAVDAKWIDLFGTEPPLVWNAAPQAQDYGKNFSDL